MDPTPYDFMMRQEPKWVTDPVPDPLDSIPHPDNPGEPLRQPAVDNYYAGGSQDNGEGGERRPFQPYDLREVAGTWKVKISPGVVQDIHVLNENGAAADSATKNPPYIPEIGGVPIFEADPVGAHAAIPDLDLPGLVSFAYVKYETNDHGQIKAPTPTIEVSAVELKSIHWKPVDETGANGEDGVVYVRIFKTISNGLAGAAEAPLIVHEGHQSNIFVDHFPSVKNLGSGNNVYKQYENDDDFLELRTLVGIYGIEATTGGNSIDFKFDAENYAGGVPVYDDPGAPGANDPAKFFPLSGGATGRDQIEVENVANKILIRGNDYDSDAGENVTSIEVVDGLVVALTTLAGADLNLTITTKTYHEDSGTGHVVIDNAAYSTQTLYWRAGIFIGNTDPADGLGIDVDVDNWT
jgi:hypothetical protein